MAGSQERRRHERGRRMLRFSYTYRGRAARGLTSNVGVGGAFLSAAVLPGLGDLVRLRYSTTSDSANDVVLDAVCVRVIDTPTEMEKNRGFAVQWHEATTRGDPNAIRELLSQVGDLGDVEIEAVDDIASGRSWRFVFPARPVAPDGPLRDIVGAVPMGSGDAPDASSGAASSEHAPDDALAVELSLEDFFSDGDDDDDEDDGPPTQPVAMTEEFFQEFAESEASRPAPSRPAPREAETDGDEATFDLADLSTLDGIGGLGPIEDFPGEAELLAIGVTSELPPAQPTPSERPEPSASAETPPPLSSTPGGRHEERDGVITSAPAPETLRAQIPARADRVDSPDDTRVDLPSDEAVGSGLIPVEMPVTLEWSGHRAAARTTHLTDTQLRVMALGELPAVYARVSVLFTTSKRRKTVEWGVWATVARVRKGAAGGAAGGLLTLRLAMQNEPATLKAYRKLVKKARKE